MTTSLNKYNKYVEKINKIKNILTKGNLKQDVKNTFTILSALDDTTFITSIRPLDKTIAGSMWFGEYNGIVQSSYNIYDIEHINFTYVKLMMGFLQYVNKLDKILLIGLGGGNIPMLLRFLYPNLIMDVVELDQSVVLAAQHMGFSEDSNMKVYVQNGITYINDNLSTLNLYYDVVLIDLDGISSFDGFNYANISDILNESGTLMINCFINIKRYKLKDYLGKRLKQSFKSIKTYVSKSNYVYCAKKHTHFTQFNDIVTLRTCNELIHKYKYVEQLLDVINTVDNSVDIE
jgi:spermidine synthase